MEVWDEVIQEFNSEIERLKALKAFKKDSMSGKFPCKKQSSNLDKKQFDEFLNQLD